MAHCALLLEEWAPSGGFAAGNGKRASATCTTSTIAVHNPSTIARITKNPPIRIKINLRKL